MNLFELQHHELDCYFEEKCFVSTVIHEYIIKFEEALEYAKKIQEENPDYLLCGSLALILYNKIPKRDVTDLDFVHQGKIKRSYQYVNGRKFKRTKYLNPKRCVFKLEKVNKGKTIKGLHLQNLDDILFFKNEFSKKRKKDEKDMNNMSKIDLYLSDDEFSI